MTKNTRQKGRKKSSVSRASPNPKIWARADMIDMIRKEHGLTVYGATNLLNSILHVLSRHLVDGDAVRFRRFGKIESRLFRQQDLVYFGRRKELPRRRVLRFSPAPRIRQHLREKYESGEPSTGASHR